MISTLSLTLALICLLVCLFLNLREKRKLSQSEAYYRSLFENQVQAVIIEEEDTTLSLANKKFEELSGYSREECEGKMKTADFLPQYERERILKYHKARVDKNLPSPPNLYETQFLTKDGKIKYVQVYAALVPGTKKTIAILTDVTQAKKAQEELQRAYELNLRALTTALEAREHGTARHCDRVARYAELLARRIGMDENYIKDIKCGAFLHDIGKIGVRDSLLLKPGRLTLEEMKKVKKHPLIGARILKGIDYFTGAIDVVLYHHERWDGKGYPMGLAGDKIPLSARIFAVVDAFDAMTTNRPYRRKISIEDARAEIKKFAGKQFDPKVVEAFLSIPSGQWRSVQKKLR